MDGLKRDTLIDNNTESGLVFTTGKPRILLIESDPNRCILCEKCVKVDHEVVGCDAIAVVNRGEATIIDTIDGKPLNCEFCGNCVGSCHGAES